MSFISDLLVEISSFRIRIGNKLNALKTLIDGKAEIDGSNIPAGTFWSQFKAGGVGNYIYVDVQENDFTRVMVWKNGGWAWTNKSGFQTWLGLDDYLKTERLGLRNYAFLDNLLQKSVTVGEDADGRYVEGGSGVIVNTLFTNQNFEENTSYTLFFRGYAGNTSQRFFIYYTDGSNDQLFFLTSLSTRTLVTPAHKTVDYITFSYGSGTTVRLYDL